MSWGGSTQIQIHTRTDGRQRIEAIDVVQQDLTGAPEVMQPPVAANLFAWDVRNSSVHAVMSCWCYKVPVTILQKS